MRINNLINSSIIFLGICSLSIANEWDELFSFNIQSRPTTDQVELFIDIVVDDMLRWDNSGDGKLSRLELLRYFRYHKGLDIK